MDELKVNYFLLIGISPHVESIRTHNSAYSSARKIRYRACIMYLALQNDGHENDQKEKDYDHDMTFVPETRIFFTK